MAVSPIVPVGALISAMSARPKLHACRVRVVAHAPPPIRPQPIFVPVAVPVPDRADGMLSARAVGEIERLRSELGASDMALQSARSDAARWRMSAQDQRRDGDQVAPAAPTGDRFEGRPVPGTMKPRPHDSNGTGPERGAPGAAGAAPLVRTVVVQAPRSLIDLFG